jgi:hypothetical protein
MTDAEIKNQFSELHTELAAILVNQGFIIAEIRAFRDAMFMAKDKPNVSGDKLFEEYQKRFGEYARTMRCEPEKILEALSELNQQKR